MRSYVCRTYDIGETVRVEAYAIGDGHFQVAFHRGTDEHAGETAFTISTKQVKGLRKALKLALKEAKENDDKY